MRSLLHLHLRFGSFIFCDSTTLNADTQNTD